MSCVYTITHKATGMFYIGCTDNLNRRRGEHIRALERGTHRNQLLQLNYISDPGLIWNIIELPDHATALKQELIMIRENSDNNLMMNVVGKPLDKAAKLAKSLEWDDTMRKAASTRAKLHNPPERMALLRKKSRGYPLGSKHTDEAKVKISLATKGKSKSLTHRKRIGIATSKKISVNGVVYNSGVIAARELGLNQATVSNRCRNVNFPDWYFI